MTSLRAQALLSVVGALALGACTGGVEVGPAAPGAPCPCTCASAGVACGAASGSGAPASASAPGPGGLTSANAVASASVAPASTGEPAPAPAAFPTIKLGNFRRELAEPVRSLAIGKPRIAAYGARVWLREGGAFKELPLPASFRAGANEREQARIFFGRDDRPRIMGYRSNDKGSYGVYLRFKDSWSREKKELARLAGEPPASLYGILGHDDPEVVCKIGDVCIIKRRSGWTSFPAEPNVLWVELTGGTAWAVGAGKLLRLSDKGFVAPVASCPYGEPGGVAAATDGSVWVSEPDKDLVHHLSGTSWTSEPSPVDGPRGLYAASANDVWLVGDGGAAHFDGTRWSRVEGPAGPLAEVRAAGSELWLAGESGVWHAGGAER